VADRARRQWPLTAILREPGGAVNAARGPPTGLTSTDGSGKLFEVLIFQ